MQHSADELERQSVVLLALSNEASRPLRAVLTSCDSLSLFVDRENLPSRFKFKEYCPMVFRNLRERFCIDDQDYQVSPLWWCIEKFFQVKEILKVSPFCFVFFLQNSLTRSAPLNSDSQGRFGNRFLSSYDHRFVIKTVSSEDIAEMHNILKKYHQVRVNHAAPALQRRVQFNQPSCSSLPHVPLTRSALLSLIVPSL